MQVFLGLSPDFTGPQVLSNLSTVASYVDALGGKLELVAVFDDERILI
jgi:hypothetical protein